MTEVQVRLSVPEDMHKKILRLQGLFAFKEGKKTKLTTFTNVCWNVESLS
jgi:hypothetical protein